MTTPPNSADLLVFADICLPMQKGNYRVENNVAVAVNGGRISWTGSASAAKNIQAKKTILGKNQILMPGLINGHTHLAMSMLRGMADDLPFGEWLNKIIFPLEARLVSPDFVRIGTELSLLESALAGSTTFVDMYYFQEETAAAIEKSGLRAIVGESAIDFPAPDNRAQDDSNYKILDRMCEKYLHKGSRVTPAIAPHAPYTCSDDTLKKSFSYAQKKNIPLLIHVSETTEEFEGQNKQHGCTPVERLHKLGLMSEPRSIFAHCVHLTPNDRALLAKTKTGAIYNPESNMKIGVGAANIPQMLQDGVLLGLGTDGCASNNNLSLFSEMDTGAKLQKLANLNSAAISAVTMLELATIRGAEALHMEKDIGSLEVGKCADMILVDLNRPHLQPLHDVSSALVYSANGSEVTTVICDGAVVVENGICLSLNQNTLFEELRSYRKQMNF